jgi:hypothetical protein
MSARSLASDVAGLGALVSLAGLHRGRDAGCDLGALESPPHAEAVYRSLGFEVPTTPPGALAAENRGTVVADVPAAFVAGTGLT